MKRKRTPPEENMVDYLMTIFRDTFKPVVK
jgi:hypothetical protein